MNDEKPKRLSIAEKRAMTGLLRLDQPLDDIADAEAEAPDEAPDWPDILLLEQTLKKPISLRVDTDVLDYFKSGGSGYQTRMNAVLRAYMDAQLKLTRR